MRKNYWIGILLIIVGSYLLLGQIIELSGGYFIVFTGLALLSVRIGRGPRGFTVAGSIILCVGTGIIISDLDIFSPPVLASANIMLLAVSFFLMHILDFRRLGNWPIVPGLCLLALSAVVFFYGYEDLPRTMWGFARKFWPVALICAGAATIGGAARRNSSAHDNYEYDFAEQNTQSQDSNNEGSDQS